MLGYGVTVQQSVIVNTHGFMSLDLPEVAFTIQLQWQRKKPVPKFHLIALNQCLFQTISMRIAAVANLKPTLENRLALQSDQKQFKVVCLN